MGFLCIELPSGAGADPHPAIVHSAATLVNKSREFDKIADEICTEWTMTAAEQMNELAALRIEHEQARQEVVDAATRFSSALLAVKQVLDAMYEAQSKVIPQSMALENRAVRPLMVALRARVAFLLEIRRSDPRSDPTPST